ncbi:type II toxin-antitoxin system death-on-curing family toxin [Caballeronia sp. INDeC2]|uniref:type II toxin-antitoxin system death-on-curing family toxin n=1 Tax=Caballeronia sp. INDeC2 TaxID=2921747 RepID=UPI0020286C58|nr:type II toxin-antitoxin system death-on-curing family toxin [Caballeronia sp. INDeC2]
MNLDCDLVIVIHDVILSEEPGVPGVNRSALEGALSRIEAKRYYDQLDDVFEIAGMYAEAIARGHAFTDANKRTALMAALVYLALELFLVPRTLALEEIMVDVAEGRLGYADLANIFASLAEKIDPAQVSNDGSPE